MVNIARSILRKFETCLSLVKEAKSAEKAKVASLEEEAKRAFDDAYSDYVRLYTVQHQQIQLNVRFDHQEIRTLAAQCAFLTSNLKIAKDELIHFIYSSPDPDQFLCKAELLYAQILNIESSKTNGMECIFEKKFALNRVMKALDIATLPANENRYNFVVYNVSITLWNIVQPFLRENRAKHFLPEMQRTCDALEAVKLKDKDWLIMFLSATAFCLEDDNQNKAASDAVDKAILYSEEKLKIVIEEENETCEDIKKNALETEEIMSAIRAKENWEESKIKRSKIDPDDPESEGANGEISEQNETQEDESAPLEGLATEDFDVLRERLEKVQQNKAVVEEKSRDCAEKKMKREESIFKLYMQRVQVNPGDSKSVVGRPNVDKTIRAKVLVQLQCIRSGIIPDNQVNTTLQQLVTTLEAVSMTPEVSESLSDICRLAWNLNHRDVAIKCCELAETEKNMNPVLRSKIDVCKAMKIVADIAFESANEILEQRLTFKQTEGYAVERRIEAVKILERVITIVMSRCDDSIFLQELCVIIWNTGYILLEPHLRKNVVRAFQLATSALEKIRSPLQKLRSQMHFELAKAEEANDFIGKALEEGKKALYCDYGELDPTYGTTGEDPMTLVLPDLNRFRVMDKHLKPFVSSLTLRSDVYNQPENAEDKILLLLQQAKESVSKTFQVDMITKALMQMKMAIDSNGSGVIDESDTSSVVSKTQSFVVPETDLSEIKDVLNLSREGDYEEFTNLTQKRISVMQTIAHMAHKHKQYKIVQVATLTVLRYVWDPQDADIRDFLYTQTDMCFALGDGLVERISDLWITEEQEELWVRDQAEGGTDLDPRVLGCTHKFASAEMNEIKILIAQSLLLGTKLALSVKDEYGYQNGAIYFWNLHIHIFRKKLFTSLMPEIVEMLLLISSSMETFKAGNGGYLIDEKLRACYIEATTLYYQQQGDMPKAMDIITKASSNGTPYIRRKLCELCGKFAAESLGGGGKGGGKPSVPVEFDDPFLNALATLAQAESPETPEDQRITLIDRATAIMTDAVPKKLETIDMKNIPQEEFDRITELRVECWTRITQLRLNADDIYGSQTASEQCLQIIADNNMAGDDMRQLSPRVWRWISVCERCFGITISRIIREDGQDKPLQDELRMASLRHFSVACHFGQKAGKEDLIVAASECAWNVSMNLISESSVRSSLMTLQRQIVSCLEFCKDNEKAEKMKVEFYVAIIDELTQNYDWEGASKVVMEAFSSIPTKHQKPLWHWRIIVMSKQGKNVLDAIQKLKESDASLQARVYAILARSSSNPKQQAEAYFKAVEVLKNDTRKVEYILETSQWMASSGLPKSSIYEILLGALDAIYELEESMYPEFDEDSKNDDETVSKTGSRTSSKTSRSGSKAGSRTGSRVGTGAGKSRPGSKVGSKPGTAKSVASQSKKGSSRKGSKASNSAGGSSEETTEEEEPRLNLQSCDMAVRANAMIALLENSMENRVKKCLELSYYIERSLELWDEANRHHVKSAAYNKLTTVEREGVEFEDFSFEFPHELEIPTDFVTFAMWTPSEVFTQTTKDIGENSPLLVPTSESICAFPLTIYYVLWASDVLYKNGYPLKAMFCVSWLCKLVQVLGVGNEDLCCLLYFKLTGLMNKSGIGSVADAIPSESFLNVNTGQFIKRLISSDTANFTTEALPLPDKANNEELAKYGFSTWTQALDGISSLDCINDIAACLLEYGNTQVAKLLAQYLLIEYGMKGNTRGQVRAIFVLSKISLMSGQYEAVLTMLLSCQDMMSLIGDASLLATHTVLLMESYVMSDRLNDAISAAAAAIDLIKSFSSFQLTPQNGIETEKSNPSYTTEKSFSDVSDHSEVENSMESVQACADVLFQQCKLHVLLFERKLNDNKINPTNAMEEIENVTSGFDVLFPLVCKIHGGSSLLAASILENRARIEFKLLQLVHQKSCIPIGEFHLWADNFAEKTTVNAQKSIDVLISLRACVPESELVFRTSFVLPNSEQQIENDQIHLNSSISSHLARCYLLLGELKAYMAVMLRENVYTSTHELNPSMSVIDRYMMETRPEEPLVTSNFSSPHISAAIHAMNTSLSFHSENTAAAQKARGYACIYNLIRLTGTKNEDMNENVVTMESESLLKAQTAIVECLNASQFDTAALGCISITDYAFSRNNVVIAAKYLVWYQSIMTRNWLLEKWMLALNPECEISASLKRLQAFSSLSFSSDSMGTAAAESAVKVERAFLEYASVSFRRLDVAADPFEITQKVVPSTTAVIMVQLDSQSQNLYVSLLPGGFTGSSDAIAMDSANVIVDKLSLNDEMTRKLDELVKSQKIWSSKISRMCSTLGDSMTVDHDVLSETFLYEDKELEKQEAETERKLDALLQDLDALLKPVLGEISLIGTALSRKEGEQCKFSDILLLLDSRLCTLPWEGLMVFEQYDERVTRDFSLHLHGHRAVSLFGAGKESTAGSTAVVQASSIKYAVDPLKEDSAVGTGYKGMRAAFDDLKATNPNISKWAPLGDLDNPLCLLDWIQLSEEKISGLGLHVNVMGRIGSILSPRELAILNFEKVYFAFIVDNAYNFISYRRQESQDNLKGRSDITCEDSVNMTALLSLSGISGIIAQSWTTSLTSQQRFISSFYSQCFEKDNNDFAVAFAAGKRVNVEGKGKLKKWIRLAKVYYGVNRIKIDTR